MTSDQGPCEHGSRLAAPARIDRYRILEPLGEGGFGVVYRAEQAEPVRREVALKVIKPGMDSKSVIARFEAERQALALMNHAGVAKVFDGGATEEGRPYFAMELVRGEPITVHCDRQKLGVRERVELMIRVCEAVQHAHNKGVIHRDLKPSNVLVGYEGGVAAPKVIDFGVAKALHQKLTEATIFTQQGQLIGTPEYMSPEQAEMSGTDIDTRSDVYSLGVLLYELLTGVRPFDGETLRRAALVEIQRIIRDVDPPKPSTRLSGSADAESIAVSRGTEVRSLSGVLRRDLDWVCMRCLEKDRERRYDTANALAEELRRFLGDQPVLAGPPSAAYRVRKFVSRRRGAVVTGLAVLGITVAGTTATAVSAIRAESARDRARDAQAVSEAVISFLNNDVLALAAPGAATNSGGSLTVREALETAASRLDERADVDPRIEAALRETIGTALLRIGDLARAEEMLESAIEMSDFLATDASGVPPHARLRLRLAESLFRQRRGAEALPVSTDALMAIRAASVEQPALLDALEDHAGAMKRAGQEDRALALYEDVLASRESVSSPEKIAVTKHNIAILLASRGDLDLAEVMIRDAAARLEASVGPRDPRTLHTRAEVGFILDKARDLEGASSIYDALLPDLRSVLTTEHWRTRQTIANAGVTAARMNDYGRARGLLKEAWEAAEEHTGELSSEAVGYAGSLAGVIELDGDPEEAERMLLDTAHRLQQSEESGSDAEVLRGQARRLEQFYIRQGRGDQAAVWGSLVPDS
ncbi:MAG: serine/threonine-protein kinase [Planctomycetota bacterium]